tara:strand:+ start:514 stop:1311 length:798 start_codon:yes stop_codon:yes gene_type:complete
MNKKILTIDKSQDGILRLILNDQKNKNALSDIMINKLINNLNNASEDDCIKVVVIAAEGDVFCSGHNLKDIAAARDNKDEGKSYFINLFNLCSSLMKVVIACKKPVIAEVDGVATAAGCQLVASCDLAIASDSSRFATPGVNIGLFCSTPMVALSRTINKKDAMQMLLTGDMIDVTEAKRVSLINDYVSKDKLKDSVLSLAKKISSKSLETIKIGKEAFYHQYEMNISEAYDYTSKVMTHNSMQDDAKEGISSFLEKREPIWKDK